MADRNILRRVSHPLRLRSFRLLFLGRTLSAVGDSVVPAALAIAVTQVTGSADALATVLACAMIPRLALLPIGGVAADRWNARRVALVTDCVRATCQLVVGIELLSSRPGLAGMATASAIGGAASAFAMPTRAPLVAGTVKGPALRQANALLASAGNLARLGGPALAGLLIYGLGAGTVFLLDAASFAVSATLLAMIHVRHAPVARRTLLADLTEGWTEVRARSWCWTSLLAHAVWNGAAAVLATIGPLIAARRPGGPGVWIALLEAGAIGMAVGSLLAARAKPRRPVLIGNLTLAGYAVPLLLLALAAPVPLVVAGYALALTGVGFLNPLWETAVQQHVPAHLLARVASYDWLVSFGAAPIGYALAPLASDAWGPSAPLVIAAALVVAACLGTAAVPAVRRLGTETDPMHEDDSTVHRVARTVRSADGSAPGPRAPTARP